MTARITTPRGRRLTWSMAIIWVVASLLVVATWGVVAELTQRDGQEVLARARRDTGNLARTIAEQTTRAMSDTDRILNFLAYDLGHRGVDRPRLQDVLKNAIDGSDLLLQLSYTDAAGTVIESSVDGPKSVVSIADREHFLVHKEGTVQGMFISRPVFGRASDKWSVQLSRRITAPDGSFAGVMVASLDPFYFSRTFDDLDIGKRGVLAIVGRDGILRARTGLNEATIGRNVSETHPFRAAMTATQGFVESVSTIDGIARLISFRTVARYPLVVLVGFDEAGFLADMQAAQRLYVVAACVATAMLLVMAVLMSWHMHMQDQARAAAEHTSHLKSEFLATISHEIRTPMNGVLGMLALLESDPLTPRQKHQADMARRSAEGLLVLLDDILDFSRLEAGKSIADQGNCEPAQIVRSVIDLLRPKAEEKGLDLSMHVGPSVPDVVVTDPTRLRQILFNLVGNALKFTSAGEVSVRVQRGADLPDDRFLLMFDVEDTGIGIPPDVVPTLFCHFTQADSSITRIYGGTGLGLAICKRLCTLLGGSIMVVSTPGKGSLFQFTISAAMGEASMPAPPPTGAPSLPPLRILVVDDNSVNLQVVDGLLSRPGHRVTAVSSGQAAIDLLKASQPGMFDVVLMDVQMPEMDGLTATRVIRALPPPVGTVPVIGLTAHGSTGSRSLCLAAGMNGFIIKPAGLQRMEHEIAAVLHLEPVQAPAGPPPPAPEALLDAAQIAELAAALDPEAWEQVTASLQQTAMTEIPRIIAAIDAGQSPAQPAHTLKGAAWNTGALRLGNLAKRLETAPPAEARQIAGELPQVLQETVAALTAQVSSNVEA